MKILGVCNANDSGASLIVDNKLVGCANEERFKREKLTRDFPQRTIDYLLNSNNLKISDIDYVGCGAWKGIDIESTLPRLVEDVIHQAQDGNKVAQKIVMDRVRATSKSDSNAHKVIHRSLIEMGFPEEKIIYCDHHRSHALTAFYPSPFEEAYIFCADGRGDFRSVTLWKADRKNGLELVDLATEMTSPGAMYGFVTKAIGFIPDRHEGKVTGLAARGKKTRAYDILKEGFFYCEKDHKLKSSFGDCYRPFGSAEMVKIKEGLTEFTREDLAFAAQRLLEETLTSFLMHHLGDKPEGSINLCLAGGCMGNVKLNYEIMSLKPVKNIYVAPAMGDGGNAFGGAIHVAIEKDGLEWLDMPTAYLGSSYNNDEIEKELEKSGVNYQKVEPSEKSRKVAELIADNVIIGWFQGNMEYGPRALASRSILASPTNPDINDSLNDRLDRSEFMPFAPVTIESLADDCFEGWKPDHVASKFMTVCYKCKPIMKERCPAVVHIDNTARPQVVFRHENPEYHDVVKHYYEITGNPAIINTSFNHHEEPILESPSDAVRSFKKNNVDVLVIGDFFVTN